MRGKNAFNHLYIFYSFIFLLNVVHVFWSHPVLYSIIGMLGVVMVLINFPRADRVFKILGVILLAAGTFFFFSSEASVGEIPAFFAGNIGLLFLISMLPWMNSVVKAGRYNKLLQSLLGGNVKGMGSFYVRSEVTMVSLAAFLNLSSATISQELLKHQLEKVKTKVKNSFIAMSTLRGYSLALLWSPLEILLATSIFITGANYLVVLPWMIMIALLGFALDASIGKILFRKHQVEGHTGAKKDLGKNKKKLTQFISALVMFLVVVVFLANVVQFDFLFAVTIAIFPFAFMWAVLMKRKRSFIQIGWPTWKKHTNHLNNFIVLLLALSFLTETLNASPYLEYLQDPIVALEGSPLFIMLFIQAAFLGMTLLGVHPLATMGIFGGVSELLMGALPEVTLTILLASCAIATVPSAPYGLIVTITSVGLRMNPYEIVLKNLPYSLLLGFLGVMVSLLTLMIY
ncbi:hypothetical protein GCM10010954_27320 [Halobacillus andaensis]|uniref:Uncharacterized protein n=1 Tax=Halobacillus andaensis TaxID=1176239 RepID=A0A917B620_HALAA|nr:hypothetical protein [Halobacillus andaensis]MBP2005682.1 hypothetical protein [Halobacillus andaensis]GGF26792.1 hypothetical protein GCM10010954_27320 [Halobacillus andaensis]